MVNIYQTKIVLKYLRQENKNYLIKYHARRNAHVGQKFHAGENSSG